MQEGWTALFRHVPVPVNKPESQAALVCLDGITGNAVQITSRFGTIASGWH